MNHETHSRDATDLNPQNATEAKQECWPSATFSFRLVGVGGSGRGYLSNGEANRTKSRPKPAKTPIEPFGDRVFY